MKENAGLHQKPPLCTSKISFLQSVKENGIVELSQKKQSVALNGLHMYVKGGTYICIYIFT
jgi:hypothetical protein